MRKDKENLWLIIRGKDQVIATLNVYCLFQPMEETKITGEYYSKSKQKLKQKLHENNKISVFWVKIVEGVQAK